MKSKFSRGQIVYAKKLMEFGKVRRVFVWPAENGVVIVKIRSNEYGIPKNELRPLTKKEVGR